MQEEEIYHALSQIVTEKNVLAHEPMKKHTSFRVGGKADFFVMASTIEPIKKIMEFSRINHIPLTVIGNGTNLLVKDGGIRGITLKLAFKTLTKQVEQNTITYCVGSSVPLAQLASQALKDEATGLEFAVGIPGTLGGAIRMNAGAYGSQIQDILQETTYLDKQGICHTITNRDHEFGYRHSIFENMSAIILESKLVLVKGSKQEIAEKMATNQKARQEKQPTELPSAGSTFKRGDGFITAKVIDECGLKGYRIGGAQVSEKHAGFIVNAGNATAKDILALIQCVKKTVKEKTGLEIEEEIQIIGEE